MAQGVSRRNLAKGVAWTLPAVAVACAAPAYAASQAAYPVTCPTDCKVLEYYSTDISTMNVTSYSTPDGGKTSSYAISFNLGWKVPSTLKAQDGSTISGFILSYGYCTQNCMSTTTPGGSLTGVNQAGTKFTGKINATAPALCEPRLASGGGSTTLSINTSLPYKALYCDNPDALLAGVSIPVTVWYLDGISVTSNSSSGCCSYLNLTFNNKGCPDGTFGYDITGYSFSCTPQY